MSLCLSLDCGLTHLLEAFVALFDHRVQLVSRVKLLQSPTLNSSEISDAHSCSSQHPSLNAYLDHLYDEGHPVVTAPLILFTPAYALRFGVANGAASSLQLGFGLGTLHTKVGKHGSAIGDQ